MAYAVWSTPLIQYTPAAPNTEFIVPTGFTAVVRQISVVQDYGAYAGGIYIADSSEAPPNWIFYGSDIGSLEMIQQEGRWVALEGAYIVSQFSPIGGNLSVYVGGYLLRNN